MQSTPAGNSPWATLIFSQSQRIQPISLWKENPRLLSQIPIYREGAGDAEKVKFMEKFLSKHSGKLKAAALILMLLIPFFLFAAAMHGSAFQVYFFLALMAGNMLFIMIRG